MEAFLSIIRNIESLFVSWYFTGGRWNLSSATKCVWQYKLHIQAKYMYTNLIEIKSSP